MSEYQKAQFKAEEILKSFKITTIPVPVEEIVQRLNIKISFAPNDECSGILIRQENDTVLMGINSNDPPMRIRFTIAHELGHYFLENKKVAVDFRSYKHRSDKPKSEKIVDFFAANLLMPEKSVITDLKKTLLELENRDEDSNQINFIEKLANKYQVSIEAMKNRILSITLNTANNNDLPI